MSTKIGGDIKWVVNNITRDTWKSGTLQFHNDSKEIDQKGAHYAKEGREEE